jgi:hypothetical protein
VKRLTWLLSIGLIAALLPTAVSQAVAQADGTHILPLTALANRQFGNDAPWFEQNIPFFECSDPQIEQIYYYRWKLYKSHLKDLGERGYIVTEFLDDVGWAWNASQSLNDATTFHIMEGRWLKDSRYVDNYIDYMYTGGNDRHFSEAIVAAAYARYLANADRAFAVHNLSEMKRIYRLWDDHYDAAQGLYFIEPLSDATEYTIASIDATGGRDGFGGGEAFRPSINSYMQANADAISKLAALAGDTQTAGAFAEKAAYLKNSLQTKLWNDGLQHFIDRFQVNNRFVKYGTFVRGRELVGYTPWYFNLPDNDPRYAASWRHLLSPEELGGPYGLRTVEPSYDHYMQQYRYAKVDGKDAPECQWNGPSWPYQTTLALGAMANFLNSASHPGVTAADYLRLLKQYAGQHYLNGEPDLQEDYNPDTGKVIVGLPRSHHYNHSGYVDLVITGLAGLRPRADNVLEVNPLIPTAPAQAANAITYFCLENVLYHGQSVTILFDRDGKHYGKGAGLSLYVNGRRMVSPSALGRKTVLLPAAKQAASAATPPIDLAVNYFRKGFPIPAASVNSTPDALYQAVDGRVWFWSNVRNYWSNAGSHTDRDWFSIDLGRKETVRSVNLYFYGDGVHFKAPTQVQIQYWNGEGWAPVAQEQSAPSLPLENGENTLTFAPVATFRLRAMFTNPKEAAIALVEMKIYGNRVSAPEEIVDRVYPNDAVSEAAHGLQSLNSQAGNFMQARWRTATDGGFFRRAKP